jgi:hypothetical protein
MTFGPRVAFYATAAVVLTAALPILGAPNFGIAASAPAAFRAALRGVRLFAADGWCYGAFVVWQLARHGANLNAKESRTGTTALMWAAAEDRAAAVTALVALGATSTSVARDGLSTRRQA